MKVVQSMGIVLVLGAKRFPDLPPRAPEDEDENEDDFRWPPLSSILCTAFSHIRRGVDSALTVLSTSRFDALRLLKNLSTSKGTSPDSLGGRSLTLGAGRGTLTHATAFQ